MYRYNWTWTEWLYYRGLLAQLSLSSVTWELLIEYMCSVVPFLDFEDSFEKDAIGTLYILICNPPQINLLIVKQVKNIPIQVYPDSACCSSICL